MYNSAIDLPSTLPQSRRKSKNDEQAYKLVSKLAVEFLGSFLLTFIGLMSGLKTHSKNYVINTAFAFGFTQFVLMNLFGHISGCHLNPMLSFANLLIKKLQRLEFLLYLIFQLIGMFCGALLVRATVQPFEFEQLIGIALYLSNFQQWYHALLASVALSTLFIANFLISYVDLIDHEEEVEGRSLAVGALSVGMSLSLSIFATGLTLNPFYDLIIRIISSLFLNIADMSIVWRYIYAFLLGPIFGTFIAFVLHRVAFARVNRII